MDMRRRLTYLAVVLLTISIVIAVVVPRMRGSEASRPDPAASGPWFDIAFTTPAETDQPGTHHGGICLLYTSPSPRDRTRSRMPSSA